MQHSLLHSHNYTASGNIPPQHRKLTRCLPGQPIPFWMPLTVEKSFVQEHSSDSPMFQAQWKSNS